MKLAVMDTLFEVRKILLFVVYLPSFHASANICLF